MTYDHETGRTERLGGVIYTIRIRDGVVYDAKGLLSEVRRRVRQAKESRAIRESPGG